MREIARGAEAAILDRGDAIVKDRLKKGYRIPELDEELRQQRTKREASLLKKIKIPHPKLLDTDGKERIVMEKIEGAKLREALDDNVQAARTVGGLIAELHNQDIIHGDLTTSNMMLTPQGNIVMIDFGLSFHSKKIEDKAVDLHLFKEALESKHHHVLDEAWKEFLKGYSSAKGYNEILQRLRAVEKRGRYKKG